MDKYGSGCIWEGTAGRVNTNSTKALNNLHKNTDIPRKITFPSLVLLWGGYIPISSLQILKTYWRNMQLWYFSCQKMEIFDIFIWSQKHFFHKMHSQCGFIADGCFIFVLVNLHQNHSFFVYFLNFLFWLSGKYVLLFIVDQSFFYCWSICHFHRKPPFPIYCFFGWNRIELFSYSVSQFL